MALTKAAVETAIEAILTTGQSVSIDGVSYSQANLSSLIAMRDTMEMTENRTGGNRPVFRGFNFTGAGY
jgi:hypothetical protein